MLHARRPKGGLTKRAGKRSPLSPVTRCDVIAPSALRADRKGERQLRSYR